MSDYERTTVRQSVDETVDPTLPSRRGPRYPSAPRDSTAPRTTVVRERVAATIPGSIVLQRFIALVFGILQGLLILRVVLLLLIANHDNGIVSAILGVTDILVEPFRGMFRLDRIADQSGSILDVAALVALIGWTLLEMLALAVVRLVDRRGTTRLQ